MQEAKKRASRSAANTFSRGALTVISPVSFICRPSLLPPNASARLAVPAGLEPATFGLGNRCSIRLSYGTGTISINGSAGRRNRQGGAGIFPDQVRSRRGNELGEKKSPPVYHAECRSRQCILSLSRRGGRPSEPLETYLSGFRPQARRANRGLDCRAVAALGPS